MPVRLTLLGLNQIGASIGLGLAAERGEIQRTGWDSDSAALRQAENSGAIDSATRSLTQAVQDADVVVLALPVDQIRETLAQIGPLLKAGAVVLDTSPVKQAVTAWAQASLPPERYFVTFTPTLYGLYLEVDPTGPSAVHADLFKNSYFFVTCPPGTEAGAIRLAHDLAEMLGGKALFADPLESDGLYAAAGLLPRLAAAALVNATATKPGWEEGSRLAGYAYARATEPVKHLDESKALGLSALLNRDNAVRVINNLIAALVDLRDAIADNKEDELLKLFKQAVQGRQGWFEQHHSRLPSLPADRPASAKPEEPTRRSFLDAFGKRKPDQK